VIGYDRVGTGPPLVLLHGLGGERHVWRACAELLHGERDVICMDLPGFGASEPLPPDVTPTPWAIAEALHAFFDRLGLDRPDVAGNSLGGWIALELAKRDAVASVTALCPALWTEPLPPKPFVMHRIGRALRPALPLLMRARSVRRFVLAGIVAHPERVTTQDALGVARAYADAPGFVATNTAMRANVFSGGERVRVPVTLAWGEHDRMVMPRRGVVRDETTVVLRGCGHLPMLDDPAQTARVLLRGSGGAPVAGAVHDPLGQRHG
jgi:pimeloyl-ACP methyl ester carboxylesterase